MFILDVTVNPGSTNPYGLVDSSSSSGSIPGSIPGPPPGPSGTGESDSYSASGLSPTQASRLKTRETGESTSTIVSGVAAGTLLMAFLWGTPATTGLGAALLMSPMGLWILGIVAIFAIVTYVNKCKDSVPPKEALVGRMLGDEVSAGRLTSTQVDEIKTVAATGDDAALRAKLLQCGVSEDKTKVLFENLEESDNKRNNSSSDRWGMPICGAIFGLFGYFLSTGLTFAACCPAILIGFLIGFLLYNLLFSNKLSTVGQFISGLTGGQAGVEAYPNSLRPRTEGMDQVA